MLHIARPLLTWFYENRRQLPFREDPTPYHIWISEIMLQQTRMHAVLPYYERFMHAYPTPAALAEAELEAVYKHWEGLGYYSRARNLHRAARVIVEKYGGELPTTYEELLTLPGVGEYTAGAIASISLGMPVPAVDGNVLRVFSRLHNDRADIARPETKHRFTSYVMEEQPPEAPGDFNQALMELGALVCIPKTPRCTECPLRDRCEASLAGTAATLPAKAEKKPRRVEHWSVLLVRSPRGWLLWQRPQTGLLAGLWQPPMIPEDGGEGDAWLLSLLPGAAVTESVPLPPSRHVFTHIEWEMTARQITLSAAPPAPAGYVWAEGADLTRYAIPNAFRAYKGILVL